ncbi:uncharacterized protein LOC131229362 [Magnolia sinica]|uniref:uncharacterized protein LOC131229362 n=1 Tax=Magnolia sinica TaxID=86752 RepID=UPI00265924CF|nr:uncharacterized protein LOC131229362 [Magnolia sinica]
MEMVGVFGSSMALLMWHNVLERMQHLAGIHPVAVYLPNERSGKPSNLPTLRNFMVLPARTRQWYNLDNTMHGFYIVPAFMDKLVVHVSKNFMTLPNIKVLHFQEVRCLLKRWLNPMVIT